MPLNVTPAGTKEERSGGSERRGRKGETLTGLNLRSRKKEKSVEVTASSLASGLKGVLALVTCFIFDK